jgi:hypothetical protein
LILSIFGGYWAFLEPKFWEEVGDEQPISNLYKPGLFEAMGEQSEQIYAEGKPSQSHFDAEKLLRSRSVVGPFLGALDVRFVCRFLCRVLEI